jgi:dipeptidyl aminopeptidase/acylaminoacyl peptidase
MTRPTLVLLAVSALFAQGTADDYKRALDLSNRPPVRAVDVAGPVNWIGDTDRFWYRKTVKGGYEFVQVDARAASKRPAFDHARLAATLSKEAGASYTALTLPFVSISYADGERGVMFVAAGATWRCDLVDYSCRKTGTAPPETAPGRRPGPDAEESPAEFDNDVADGMVSPQVGQRQQQGQLQGGFGPFVPPPPPQGRPSPDGKWEAVVVNFNVHLRPKGETGSTPLSFDGSENNYYTLQSIAWSPDSRRLAAYRVRPGYRREVHFIESSPSDQLQPKHWSRFYAKPGDTLDVARPVLFDTETRRGIEIDNALFPNPYSLTPPVWWKDGRGFTFEYNQRGHQLYRVVEVDLEGRARALITEESRTFINYRPLVANQRDSGKKVRRDLDDGREIIWMSERDGWAHLYLYDGLAGRLKHQITKGDWVVRAVDHVDEKARQIWFQASGMHAGKDPYFIHYFRINFDGTGLVAFTEADGNHTLTFSPDRKHYVDTWSRVDLAPVAELRSTVDRSKVMDLERGDMQPLLDTGWRPPEVFTAKGRDGKTDIWGVIHRPRNFDPSKKYPVIERIYAGPQGSFVQKSFSELSEGIAELGFITVQIDGMGTNNRSKAFHEVAWKNLGDAGFPDRILWHKAVAAKYPYYDITRVGIHGNSAGGQSTLGGLLFHGDFYKAGAANSGCHDNRMDKIWWNEQWMGWPIGPHYSASSNVDNAHRLQGKLLLIVGELDTNVDPASTLQVVNALIKANKKHDLLFVPGGGHGAGGTFGRRLLWDFFVHHLHGVEPPDWDQ